MWTYRKAECQTPTDRIAEVQNGGKPGQPNTSDQQAIRSPKWAQYGQEEETAEPTPKPAEKPFLEKVEDAAKAAKDAAENALDAVVDYAMGIATDFVRAPETIGKVTGRPADGLDGLKAIKDGSNSLQGANKTEDHDKVQVKKMVNPDAGGGNDASTEDISRIAKVHFGSVEHGINPDLGAGGRPRTSGELKVPIDPLLDPMDGVEVETSNPRKAKLAVDIHGPRTVNSDGGYEAPRTGRDMTGLPGGQDPNTGNPS